MRFDEFLCCPLCKGDLVEGLGRLECPDCGIEYLVHEGIPLLVDPDMKSAHLEGQIAFFTREASRRPPYTLDPWMRRYLERFKEAFPGFQAGLAVDCGTGSGYMAVELARMGFDVIAFDITMQNLLDLKRQASEMGLSGEINLVCCDAQELPLRAGIADVMVSIFLLEHLPDERRAVAEIERVSKEDARLMIGLPLKYGYLNPMLVPVNFLYDRYIGHLRRYDEESLCALLEGWELLATFFTGHFGKCLKTGINLVAKVFTDKRLSEDRIELEDRKKQDIRYGASNVACMFERRSKTREELPD